MSITIKPTNENISTSSIYPAVSSAPAADIFNTLSLLCLPRIPAKPPTGKGDAEETKARPVLEGTRACWGAGFHLLTQRERPRSRGSWPNANRRLELLLAQEGGLTTELPSSYPSKAKANSNPVWVALGASPLSHRWQPPGHLLIFTNVNGTSVKGLDPPWSK